MRITRFAALCIALTLLISPAWGRGAWAEPYRSNISSGGGGAGTRLDESGPVVPPPLSPSERPPALYDYAHAVRSDTKISPVRKYRVAVARTQDNKVLDTDFGLVTGGERSVRGKDEKTKTTAEIPERYATPAPSMSAAFRALVIDQLVQSAYFEVIERDDILPILREIKFGESRYVDKTNSVATGQLAGVEYLVNGEVDLGPAYKQCGLTGTMYGAAAPGANAPANEPPPEKYQVILRMYSVATGAVEGSGVGLGQDPQAALEESIAELIRSLPAVDRDLRIAEVRGDRAYIDGGLNRGLAVGMRLGVEVRGEPIRSRTGEVIGSARERLGTVEVIDVQERVAVARPVGGLRAVPAEAYLVPE